MSGPRRGRANKRAAILARDGALCAICGKPMKPKGMTFDHIVPSSLGGTDALANLQLAHKRCNGRRGNQPLKQSQSG